MNKNMIARELKKIAKDITAGGGAGIKFKATEVDGELEFAVTVKNGDFKLDKPDISEKLFIRKFDAKGYSDGMTNVKGKKVFKECYINDKNLNLLKCYIKEVIKESRFDEGEFVIDAYFEPTDEETVIFRGWTRGTLAEGSLIEFPVCVEVCSDVYRSVYNLNITCVLSKDGERWYKTVFEDYDDMDDEEREIILDDFR